MMYLHTAPRIDLGELIMANIDAYDARNGNFRDLRDLGDLHEELTARTACDYCGEEVKPDPSDDDHFVHAADGRFVCDDEYPEADRTHADAQDFPDDVEIDVLGAIEDLMSEFGSQPFRDGGAMVSESEWEDFAREEAEDTGMIERDSPMHPYVDWSAWADALSQDYSSTVFLGESYYVRAY